MREDYGGVMVAAFFTLGVAVSAATSKIFPESPGALYFLSSVSAFSVVVSVAFAILENLPPRWLSIVVFFLLGVYVGASWFASAPAGPSFGLPAFAGRLGDGLRGLIDSIPYEDPRVRGLVKALVSGCRDDLPREVRDAFRASGASHLLALSGMHIGIIYLAFERALAPVARGPVGSRLKGIAGMMLCILYTMITGAGPSIVRACLFICLRECASLVGRKVSSLRIFSDALVIQLFFAPGNILLPGFQLSYLAMAGIFILFPKLEKMYEGEGILSKIWKLAVLSISCQIFTAPAAWFHFHTFPRHFLITNLLAAPLMTLIMLGAIAVMALGAMGICPSALVFFNEMCCKALLFVVDVVSGL